MKTKAAPKPSARAVPSPEARQFAGEGYVNLRGAFADVEAFSAVIGSIDAEIHPLSGAVLDLVNACGFEERLAALMPGAPRVELLQSRYLPISRGKASSYDGDIVSPRPYKRETLCGLWLALDGSSRLNGALFGWPGSHKVAVKPQLADYAKYGDYSRDLTVTMVNAGLKPRFIYADPGDVVVWASDFVHGGASPLVPNIPRRSLVLHYGAPAG